MRIIDTLIFDRTAQDSVRSAELHEKITGGTATSQEFSEWISTNLKGAYNHTDLNRVALAAHYLSEVFNSYGYMSEVSANTNWKPDEIPVLSQLDTLLSDVKHLRGIVSMLPTTPQTPESMALLTWAKANDIEKILQDVDRLLQSMKSVFLQSPQESGNAHFYWPEQTIALRDSLNRPLYTKNNQQLRVRMG